MALVLTAAVLHATWNAVVKGAAERSLVLSMVASGHVIVGGVALFVVGTPVWAAWPFIIASALIHYAYYGFLFLSYRHGDLSQVYPIARGVAPMLVALGAWVFVGERLGLAGWAAVALVSSGIAILAIGRNGALSASRAAVGSALVTGALIAAYSVVDGIGIRRSEAVFGYMAWIFVLEAPIVALVLFNRGEALVSLPRRVLLIGLAAGLISVLAYALALYAKTIAPLAAVSAVRESSVIIAALIGVILFGERPWPRRVVAAAIVVSGVIILAVAGGGH